MHLQKIAIHGLRNLDHVDITLGSGPNFFFGANGSGKTSLLEAVYLLSRGKSFRNRNLRTVINHDSRACTCFGALVLDSGRAATLGVSRERGGNFTFKVDGEVVKTASRLAETLPVQLVNSETFLLLEGSPSHRRSFLDWGVFHVEQGYRQLWLRFQRCLKHRNSLLRHGRIDALQMAAWDREFAGLAQALDERRSHYLTELVPVIKDVVGRLGLPADDWSFEYSPGWDKSRPLQAQLEDGLDRDQKSGFTQAGPHRADLKVLFRKRAAADVLSRGQTKLLVTALKVAQGFLYRQVCGRNCLYLLDDLPAELDRDHRLKVGELLAELGVQVLITGVDKEELLQSWPTGDDDKWRYPPHVFHVKHGIIEGVLIGQA